MRIKSKKKAQTEAYKEPDKWAPLLGIDIPEHVVGISKTRTLFCTCKEGRRRLFYIKQMDSKSSPVPGFVVYESLEKVKNRHDRKLFLEAVSLLEEKTGLTDLLQ